MFTKNMSSSSSANASCEYRVGSFFGGADRLFLLSINFGLVVVPAVFGAFENDDFALFVGVVADDAPAFLFGTITVLDLTSSTGASICCSPLVLTFVSKFSLVIIIVSGMFCTLGGKFSFCGMNTSLMGCCFMVKILRNLHVGPI